MYTIVYNETTHEILPGVEEGCAALNGVPEGCRVRYDEAYNGETLTTQLPPQSLEASLKSRAVNYLPWDKQLDMQYWDSVNNTTNWVDHVAAIKALFPKPE